MSTRLLTSGEGEPDTTARRPVSLAPRARGSALCRAAIVTASHLPDLSPPVDSGVQRAYRNPLKRLGLAVRKSDERDNPTWHPSRTLGLLRSHVLIGIALTREEGKEMK